MESRGARGRQGCVISLVSVRGLTPCAFNTTFLTLFFDKHPAPHPAFASKTLASTPSSAILFLTACSGTPILIILK